MDKDYLYKMSADELQSKTIDFLRFPLIVGVVFIHTDFSDIVMTGVKQTTVENYPLFYHFFILVSKIIFNARVPLFFFFAGFLFFYKTAGFSMEIYLQKLKNRVRSLLIPYVFWNLLVILFLMLAQTFLSGSLVSGRNKLITDYSFLDWLWSFWDTSQVNPHLKKTLPINSPFWFIRDLMVLVLLSPLVYFLIKKLKAYAVVILGLIWFFNPYFYWPGLSTVSFFFFAAGAYFGVFRKNFVSMMKPLLPVVVLLYLLLIFVIFYTIDSKWWDYVYCVSVCLGLVLAVSLTAECIQKGKWHVSRLLTNAAFFIFAYHRIPLVFVIKFLFKLVRPQSDLMLLFLYLFAPILIIVLGLLSYSFLKQWFPRFTAIICGGR